MTTQNNAFPQIMQDLGAQKNIRVLSLDCFDTLLWRKLDSPLEVWTANARHFPVMQRMRSEGQARNRKEFLDGRSEPTIVEISREHLRHGTQEDWERLAQTEIDTEIRFDFIFEPALQALKAAKERGLRTIVVSDTYYTEAQLRSILGAVHDEVLSYIDKIYCSCDYGRAKSNGLWPLVIDQENVRPNEIYHVGDNYTADVESPGKLGVNARFFEQQNSQVKEVLSARANPAKVFLGSAAQNDPIPNLFHGWLAQYARGELSRSQLIAYTLLGPVMYAFGQYMKDEVQTLEQTLGTGNVKVAYLYRDGYILERATKAFYPGIKGYGVRISRFCAYAASLCDTESITRAVGFLINSLPFERILDQLQVQGKLRRRILAAADTQKESTKRRNRFYTELMRPEVQRHILDKAAAYRARLIKYLKKTTGIQAGQTLVLVDVGYDGTTQTVITKALEQDLDIKVIARYMIALPVSGWEGTRKGLIDGTKMDEAGLQAMTRHIAGFELFCSSHDASLKDYTEEGEPIFTEIVTMPEEITQEVRQIQDHCIEFIENAQRYFDRLGHPAPDALWKCAVADLMRFNYLPSRTEVQMMQELTFEANLGQDVGLSLVDLGLALNTMRSRGVAMLTNEKSELFRTNYPAELRHTNIDFALAMMASHRNNLRYAYSDSTYRHESIETMFVTAQGTRTVQLDAMSTFDGYFTLIVPNVDGEIVIMLGKQYRAVQLDGAHEINKRDLYSDYEAQSTWPLRIGTDYFIDGATEPESGVLVLTEPAFIYIPRRPGVSGKDTVYNFVIRPLANRVKGKNQPTQSETEQEATLIA